MFPEGDAVAVASVAADLRVVGLGAGFFIDFDLDRPDQTFKEVIAGGYFTNHDPDGDWYYGADISVHPEHRGRGIGRRLYVANVAAGELFDATLTMQLRNGFELRGVIRGYIDDGTADGWASLIVWPNPDTRVTVRGDAGRAAARLSRRRSGSAVVLLPK